MDSSQSKILNYSILVFIMVIFTAMLIRWIASPGYKMQNTDVLAAVTSDESRLLPWQLHDMIRNNTLKDYLLVDLRTPEMYNSGTLPGAVNIPIENILDKKTLRELRKAGKPVILFCGDQTRSSVAQVLLRGKGFEDLKILANGYFYVKAHILDEFQPASAFSASENARFDFNRFFRTGGGIDQPAARTTTIPEVPKTETVQVQGGC